MAWTFKRSTTRRKQSIVTLSEKAVGDSDKIFDVTSSDNPVGGVHAVEVTCIRIEYTATAGMMRQLVIQVVDEDTEVVRELELDAGIIGSTTAIFEVAPGLVPQSGSKINYETLPDSFYVYTGQKVRIFDNNVVDLSGDSMIIHLTMRLLD